MHVTQRIQTAHTGLLAATLLVVAGTCLPAGHARAEPFAYVANRLDEAVTVIDTASNLEVASVNLNAAPFDFAISPNGTKLYVSTDEASIKVVDAPSRTVDTITLPAGTESFGLKLSPDGNRLYLTSHVAAGEVLVLDTANETVTGSYSVGSFPRDLAVSADETKIYVANQESNALSIISTGTGDVQSLDLGAGQHALALHPDGGRLYVAVSSVIEVVDTQSPGVARSLSPSSPGSSIMRDVVVSRDGARLYAAGQDSRNDGTVWFFDISETGETQTDSADFPLSGEDDDVERIALSGDGKSLYATNGNDDGRVWRVDTTSARATTMMPVNAESTAIAVTPGGPSITAVIAHPQNAQRLYAASRGRGVFLSTDGGGTWSAVSTGLDSDATRDVRDILFIDGGAALYAGTAAGVFKSTDDGASWSPVNNGLDVRSVLSLRSLPGSPDIVIAGTQGGGVFKTTDAGASWEAINDGLP